jgi:hypothetical protein
VCRCQPSDPATEYSDRRLPPPYRVMGDRERGPRDQLASSNRRHAGVAHETTAGDPIGLPLL